MTLLHLIQHITSIAPTLQHLPVSPGRLLAPLYGRIPADPPPVPTPTGGGGTAYQQVNDFVANLQQFIHAIGFTVFLLCETIAAVMYMVSLNSDHNRAKALQALTTAAIGFVLLLLASGISNLISGGFH